MPISTLMTQRALQGVHRYPCVVQRDMRIRSRGLTPPLLLLPLNRCEARQNCSGLKSRLSDGAAISENVPWSKVEQLDHESFGSHVIATVAESRLKRNTTACAVILHTAIPNESNADLSSTHQVSFSEETASKLAI